MRTPTKRAGIIVAAIVAISSGASATTYTVTNTNDSGAGSLRQALLDANASGGLDDIAFSIPGAGPHTIAPLSALPTVTDPVVIDGTTQPGFAGSPIVELDGTSAGSGDGLHVTASASTIRGLVINRFPSDGIELLSGGGSTVESCYIGVGTGGGTDLGNGGNGILVYSGLNTIRKNVISGNGSHGVAMVGTAATENAVQGNHIGTNSGGTLAIGNGNSGILVQSNGPNGNQIGGPAETDRNVISGNPTGVFILDGHNNVIQGNYIGTDITGTGPLGNNVGLVANSGSSGNTVEGNVISANQQYGVGFAFATTSGNVVKGNIIGAAAAGTNALGNGTEGVRFIGAVGNTLGGLLPGDANLIANNTVFGVYVDNAATENAILGNSIHTNGGLGINLGSAGVTANDPGDADTGANNLQNFPVLVAVSTTEVSGILSSAASTLYRIELFSNAVLDPSAHGEGETFIGSVDVTTNAQGIASFTAPVTVPAGAYVTATATDPAGNTSEFSKGMQEGNSLGLIVTDAGDGADVLPGDGVNVDATGAQTLRAAIEEANALPGVQTIAFAVGSGAVTIQPGSALPTVTDPVVIDGTTQPGFANSPIVEIDGTSAGSFTQGLLVQAGGTTVRSLAIHSFSKAGVWLGGSGGSVVEGCYLGTDATGTVDLGNESGIDLQSPNNTIGGAASGQGNLISGNTNGIQALSAAASGNAIVGNRIGTDVLGGSALGNSSHGIWLGHPNRVGGTLAGEGNVISGNGSNGIRLTANGGSTIVGNLVGLDASGTADLGNGADGIIAENTGSHTIQSNVISGNELRGIYLFGASATNNIVQGNLVGLNASGTGALGNTREGIRILGSNNQVGGTDPLERNVVSANSIGIYTEGTSNTIQGNYIGLNSSGSLPFGNTQNGVQISGGAGHIVGGSIAGAGNVISGNVVGIQAAGASDVTIQGNRIGTDKDGLTAIPNAIGVDLRNGTVNSLVGGTAQGAGNLISGNSQQGVAILSNSTRNRVSGNAIHSNGSLGIDLFGTAGVNLNDPGDADTGSNNLQNFPVLTSVTTSSIAGDLNSAPNATFRIEFFGNTVADGTGYGEGETFLGFTDVTTDASGNVSFTLPFGGGPFVTATATDPSGNTSEFSAAVEAVANQGPTADAGGPYAVDEGGSVVVTATGSDPDGDLLTYAWDLDNNGTHETPGQTATFSAAALDGPATLTIGVQVTDGETTASAQATVTVANVAPTVGLITAPVDPVQVGAEVSASAAFTDPGTPDAHTATFDWGDRNTSPGTVDQGLGTVDGAHTYTTPGVYTVTLTVTDDDGDVGTSIYTYAVVYDPNGGFVTGGGWIDSPAGAYVADPALTGKANFGFVAKYKNGQSTPTGQTQFRFKAGDLTFHSTSYDWLVVAGPHAKYKGSGTINGSGDYRFMLTATDGDANGGGGTDTFRMKIWDDGSGGLIYDNQMGGSDDADATDAIEGGSITVHNGGASKPALGGLELTFGAANHPNPFNPTTTIRYALPEEADVTLTVYSVLGQAVRTLVAERQGLGRYEVQWDGRDALGRQASSGLYLYRLTAGVNQMVGKMVMAK